MQRTNEPRLETEGGPEILLSMNPSDPPPFHQLDAMPFQELSRDVLELEPGIATCEIYGVPGQSQRGIDLIATRHSSSEVVELHP